MATKYIQKSSRPAQSFTGDHAGIGVDSDTGTLFVNADGTPREQVDTSSTQTLSGKTLEAPVHGASPTGDNGWRWATVAMTAAEVKALRATPKEIIAAPGAGKYCEVFSVALVLDFATTPYTETSDDLRFKYGDTSGTNLTAAIDSTGFLDQSADMIATRYASTVTTALTNLDNKAVILHNTGDGELGAGDSPVHVHIVYRVVTAIPS